MQSVSAVEEGLLFSGSQSVVLEHEMQHRFLTLHHRQKRVCCLPQCSGSEGGCVTGQVAAAVSVSLSLFVASRQVQVALPDYTEKLELVIDTTNIENTCKYIQFITQHFHPFQRKEKQIKRKNQIPWVIIAQKVKSIFVFFLSFCKFLLPLHFFLFNIESSSGETKQVKIKCSLIN